MSRTTALVAVAVGIVASGCTFNGVENMSLPGGKGTGDGAIVVTAELPDVGTLTKNAQVKVDDVVVGTVTDLRVEDWHAVAELSLEPDVQLPANPTAGVGVNTLLGAAFVELDSPAANPAGSLESGTHIPLSRGHAYPSTEQVLSSASLALNGGGLEQLSTITTELNDVLGGGDHAVRHLLPRLESFVGALNAQQGDIRSTIRDVDRMARTFGRSRGDIEKAIDVLGPALKTLADRRPEITKALRALSALGNVATPLVRRVKADLIANLRDLEPALRALRKADSSLVRGLGFALTFPFAPETVTEACKSSYCNLGLTVDLTNPAILNGFTQPDGSIGIPGLPGVPDPSLPTGLAELLTGSGTQSSDRQQSTEAGSEGDATGSEGSSGPLAGFWDGLLGGGR